MSKIKCNLGATIVELLIVAVIVSIVAAMSVPRFQRAYERMEFRAANRDIVSRLRLARSMAITDKSLYGVYFDYATRTVTLFQDEANPGGNVFDDGEDPVVLQDTMPYNVQHVFTDMNNDCITFGPNGSAGFTGGGNILTIGIMGDVYYEHFHNVLRSTGRVRSYDSWEEWSQDNMYAG